jgi:Delta7-sterol 5-desaturase
MLIKLLGIEDAPLAIFLVLSISGLLAYFLASGLSYLLFFVWGRERFHPGYVADPDENRKARFWGALSVAGNALFMVPFHWLLSHGHGHLYWNVSDYGWPWLIASFFLYLAVTETMIYWVHRALHSDFLYDRLHKRHHQFRVTTSWVSTAFHPIDSFAQALPHHLCAFLFPVHAVMYLIMVGFVTVWSVVIHDRVSLLRWKFINYTGHHTLHHWYYQYNLGQFTTVWDRLAGTYKDPERCYEDIPEGVLVRWQDGPGQLRGPSAPVPADLRGRLDALEAAE